MNTTSPIPTTRNELRGFWGTMNEYASDAWPRAMIAISEATGQPFESVRRFLDSGHGRHFADTVQNGLFQGQPLQEAINAATRQWMDWPIGHQISRDYGIPRDLPYLTGFVIHCEITDDTFVA